MESKEEIILKIKKLLNLSEGAKEINSLEEAETAIKLANTLMLKYNISLIDVNNVENNNFKINFSEKLSFEDTYLKTIWKYKLLKVLAVNNLCEVTFNKKSKLQQILGEEFNVRIVEYLYNFLLNKIPVIFENTYYNLNNFKLKQSLSKKEYLAQYLEGFIEGLKIKLNQQFNDLKSSDDKFNSLIKINDYHIKNYIKNNCRVISLKNTTISNTEVFNKGLNDGKNVKLNKGIDNTLKVKLLN